METDTEKELAELAEDITPSDRLVRDAFIAMTVESLSCVPAPIAVQAAALTAYEMGKLHERRRAKSAQ